MNISCHPQSKFRAVYSKTRFLYGDRICNLGASTFMNHYSRDANASPQQISRSPLSVDNSDRTPLVMKSTDSEGRGDLFEGYVTPASSFRSASNARLLVHL
jgi:hypothetical protein